MFQNFKQTNEMTYPNNWNMFQRQKDGANDNIANTVMYSATKKK